jgi:hypothetical protein
VWTFKPIKRHRQSLVPRAENEKRNIISLLNREASTITI